MRKSLSLLLALVMMMALAACGTAEKESATTAPVVTEAPATETTQAVETTQATESATTEPETVIEDSQDGIMAPAQFPDYIKSYIDPAHYAEPQISEDSCYYSMEPKYRPEENALPPADGYITLDGNVKFVPGETTVSEFIALGWNFQGEGTGDKVLEGNHWTNGPILVKEGRKLHLTLVNLTEEAVSFSNAVIRSLYLERRGNGDNYQSLLDAAVDFDIDGTINQDSSLADLIAAFGEPVNISYYRSNSKEYSKIGVQWGALQVELTGDGAQTVRLTLG